MYQSKQITVVVEISARPTQNWDMECHSIARFEMQIPVIEGEPFTPSVEWTVKESIDRLVRRTIDIDPEISAEKDASIAKGEFVVVEDQVEETPFF